MPKLRIYLDTSVISHLFHDDAPERRADTEEFFENAVAQNAYDVFISLVVLEELTRTKNPVLRRLFLETVQRYGLESLPGVGRTWRISRRATSSTASFRR